MKKNRGTHVNSGSNLVNDTVIHNPFNRVYEKEETGQKYLRPCHPFVVIMTGPTNMIVE